jgi:site-specific recombinase XerD
LRSCRAATIIAPLRLTILILIVARLSSRLSRHTVQSIKTAFYSLVALADLPPGIVPYTLRHTCATWKMRGGVSAWEVGGFIGTSEAMILKHYGHHHPDHLRATADAATQSSPNDTPRTQREMAARTTSKFSNKTSR